MLGFHVCCLAPCYAVNRTGASSEEPAATEIEQEIHRTYPGHERIPPELGNTLVRDAKMPGFAFGMAPLYVFLFSEAWTTSSV